MSFASSSSPESSPILDAQQIFSVTAPTYDGARQALIPCFDGFYQASVNTVGLSLQNSSLTEGGAFNILELGAGTGLYSALLHRAYPQASLTLVDNSPPMLEQARQRLLSNDSTAAIECIDGDYRTAAFWEQMAQHGPWTAVVSTLSIHHLSPEEKPLLFQRIHEVLKPGGVFVNGDQVNGETPEITDLWNRHWLDQVKARGISDQDLADALERQKADQREPMSVQLHAMREAGFAHVDVWFQDLSFLVWAAIKDR